MLTSQVVIETAARLDITPAQAALQWLLQLAPNVLLIPGTGSVAHLRENLAAEGVALDDGAEAGLRTVVLDRDGYVVYDLSSEASTRVAWPRCWSATGAATCLSTAPRHSTR